uniref:EGF-like domain-containing protein n=2 Tax=Steinernema glaseri TaxID=37863 RepID=A0A1I7YKY2_9BILA
MSCMLDCLNGGKCFYWEEASLKAMGCLCPPSGGYSGLYCQETNPFTKYVYGFWVLLLLLVALLAVFLLHGWMKSRRLMHQQMPPLPAVRPLRIEEVSLSSSKQSQESSIFLIDL